MSFGVVEGDVTSAAHTQGLTVAEIEGHPFRPITFTGELQPAGLEVGCEVNEGVRQLGGTKDMIFDAATLGSYNPHVMTLLPGDVVLTGTPAGVSPILAGDTCVVRIGGIGELANPVATL